ASQHLVIHHAVIHHLPYLPGSGVDAEQAMAEVARVLKPGGLLHLTAKYGPDCWFDEVGRFFQHFNEASVEALLRPFPLKIRKQMVVSRYNANTAWRDWLHVTAEKV